MPEISRFFGMVIHIHYLDHNPPHFHIRYNDFRAIIAIDDLQVLQGNLPPRALGLAIEWAGKHQAALKKNWELARKHAKLDKIPPLE